MQSAVRLSHFSVYDTSHEWSTWSLFLLCDRYLCVLADLGQQGGPGHLSASASRLSSGSYT